jgi:hypothetical protein
MKTAVEWLVEQYYDSEGKLTRQDFEQAKEMEKDQIMDAHYEGKGNGMDISHPLSNTKEISAEQYYNEKFK